MTRRIFPLLLCSGLTAACWPDAAEGTGRGAGASFVSSIPGATVTDLGGTPDLVLLSVSFLQSPSGGQTYQQWLGEAMNLGSTAVCLVSLDLTFMDATGAPVLTSGTTYLFADPYTNPSNTASQPCVAPGKIGGFYQNAFASIPASTSTVTTIGAKFGPLDAMGAVPDPNAPTITMQVQATAGGYDLAGTMTGTAGTINNIQVRAFPRDPSGLVLAELTGDDNGTLEPGASYAFTTGATSTNFTDYRYYVSYLEGAGTSGARHDPGARPDRQPDRVLRAEAARDATLDTDARAARATSQR